MTPIEVESVDNTQGQGCRVNRAGCGRWRVPMLKLHISFDCQIVRQVAVQSYSRGVHEGVGADKQSVAIDEARGMIVDLTSAEEKVGVGMKLSYGIFHFRAEEEIFLAADMALVDGIGAASFKRRAEAAKAEIGEVGSGGDGKVFSTLKTGEGAGDSGKGGELKLLGSGRGGLCECDMGEGGDGGEES